MHGMEHIKPLHILQILCHYIPEDFFFNLLLKRKSVFEFASSLFIRLALYVWHCQPHARAAFSREEEIPVSIG